MRLRIPTNDEIEVVARWGAVRLLLGIGELGIYTWKQLSRLSLHCACGAENIYQQSLIQPFNALIWNDQSVMATNEEMKLIEQSIELFDFNRFRSEPDTFPHIRIIAKSGMGKTTLARYLMHLLGGKQAVITPKAKPGDWQGIEVYGKGFNYPECEAVLCELKNLMYANYQVIDQGLTPEMVNVALDEWRLIKENVAIAGELVKEFITVARDAKIRLLALAQGEQVSTWGLQGESDLGECFTDIRLGEFALDHAKRLKLSSSVQDWLSKQKRPCMIDRYPAEIPNLQGFQFNVTQSPLKRCSEREKTAEISSQRSLQALENKPNGVLEGADYLRKAYLCAKTNGVSDSDFIKQVWGASRYQEGKSVLDGWRN